MNAYDSQRPAGIRTSLADSGSSEYGLKSSDLIKPELVRLTRIFGSVGLAVRLVFIGSENIDHLERELDTWSEEHIVATGNFWIWSRIIYPASSCIHRTDQ